MIGTDNRNPTDVLLNIVNRPGHHPLYNRNYEQVLSNNNKVYLRIANNRGWTVAKNPEDDSVLFEESSGEFTEDP